LIVAVLPLAALAVAARLLSARLLSVLPPAARLLSALIVAALLQSALPPAARLLAALALPALARVLLGRSVVARDAQATPTALTIPATLAVAAPGGAARRAVACGQAARGRVARSPEATHRAPPASIGDVDHRYDRIAKHYRNSNTTTNW
jgi:hypothetical protein